MQDVNNTTFTGRIAHKVELQHTPSGTACSEFRVAVNDRVKGEDGSYADRPNYIPVKVWQGRAESCVKNLVTGQAVTVTGRLRQDSWGPDDDRKSRVYVVADNVIFGAKPKGVEHPEPVEATAGA